MKIPNCFSRCLHCVIYLFLGLGGMVWADGKMFWRESVPPEIPYQRALIAHRDGIQTMVLQSKYEMPSMPGEPLQALGWVVPLPSVPEVASMPAYVADQMFLHLEILTKPAFVRHRDIVFTVLLLCCLIGPPIYLILMLFPKAPAWLVPRDQTRREALPRILFWFFFVSLLIGVAIPAFTRTRSASGIEILEEKQVGFYDVKVIRGDNPGGLIAWLNDAGFHYGQEDKAVFAEHILREGCFVVAMLNPGDGTPAAEIVSNGLAAPLILRFPHPVPMYPLALTGTGGFDTEVLLYVATDTPVWAGDRITLRYFDDNGHRFQDQFGLIAPETFFEDHLLSFKYLAKFRDRLHPEQMKEDLQFQPFPEAQPFRETIRTW